MYKSQNIWDQINNFSTTFPTKTWDLAVQTEEGHQWRVMLGSLVSATAVTTPADTVVTGSQWQVAPEARYNKGQCS